MRNNFVTKLSATNPLTKLMSIGAKIIKYFTPSWATPPPHSYIGDIAGNY